MLTPKEWKSFQHYKERRPPWIKLHRTLLDNVDFQRLPVASRALAPMLWLLAAECEGGAILDDWSAIAWRLRMSLDDLTRALQPLIDKGFFFSDEYASEPLADCNSSHAPKTETEGETEGETDLRSIEVDRPARAPSKFDEFWKRCPRREGPNPRKPAEAKFNALVKSGCDPQMLVDEADKWRQAEASRGNVGTRFVAQIVTWLGQQRWADHAAVAFLEDDPLSKMTIEQAVAMFVKLGMWSRHAPGNAPGEPGCVASEELLALHGLGVDGRKLAA